MTVERIINILKNTKRIEKTETVEIDKVIDMLNDLKQSQINYKNHLSMLLYETKISYAETKDLSDFAKTLAYDNALEFFKCDIERNGKI